jgi:hypothetical protein
MVKFSAHVQTGHGAHPASCAMGTGTFLGVKRRGRGLDHPPLVAPRLKKEHSYTFIPLWAFMACYRVIFNFIYFYFDIIYINIYEHYY